MGKEGLFAAQFALNNTLQCDALVANMPYCLAEQNTHPESKLITHTLSNLPEQSRNNLMCTIDSVGDFTPTLATFYDKHLAFLNLPNTTGILGAGATASGVRLNGFQGALLHYQKTLEALHHQKGVGVNVNRAKLETQARFAYEKLQLSYRAELNKIASPNSMGKNRGNALSGADRGITLAQRRGRGINVASNAQALQIAKLSSRISFAGKGLMVLDAGLRINGVRNTYKQGGNWQREAAIQTTGFGLGGMAGLLSGQAMVATLTTIGLGLTPVGWVVIIGVGMVAGFGAAYAFDGAGKALASKIIGG